MIRNFLNAEKLYGADLSSTGSWCSSEFLKSLGLKINFRAKHCHPKEWWCGSQRFFSFDDETVLQKTVGQDGEPLSVGWCEAEHYVLKPERHMNRDKGRTENLLFMLLPFTGKTHPLKVAAGVRMKRRVANLDQLTVSKPWRSPENLLHL